MTLRQQVNEQLKNWERIGVNAYRRGIYTVKTTGAEWVIIKDNYSCLSNSYKNMINAIKFVNKKFEE